MENSAKMRRSTSPMVTLMITVGLFVVIGYAIYILTQENSTRLASHPDTLQATMPQPTSRTGLRVPTFPERSRMQPAFLTPQIAQPTTNQQALVLDETVVKINNVALSKRTLQVVLDADHAVALLLNTTVAIDHTAALERLINGELVRQAAQPTGFRLAEATIKQSLQAFLAVNQKDEADLEKALTRAKLSRAEFVDYFGHLLLIDRFVRKASAQLQVTDATYLQQLQQAAHISFGPAAVIEADRANIQAAPSAVITTNAATKTVVADDAISFTLPVLNDANAQTLTLNSLLGHPTVLSFWTTWCPYCKKQTPLLVAAHAQYAQQGIQFVGIDVKDAQASVQTYITENHILYPIPLDTDGHVANAYNVHGFPTTLFLDAQGHVVARQIGLLTAEKLTKYIQQLVKNLN